MRRSVRSSEDQWAFSFFQRQGILTQGEYIYQVSSFCKKKHRKNCECCPVSLLIVRSQWLMSWSQVLHCRKCKKFHTLSCLCHGLCICICLCHCLSNCLLVGQAMYHNHSDHMSQRSQVSMIALWMYSLNVFVFFIVFLLVRLCFLITLSLSLSFFWPGQVFSSLWSNVSKVTSL